MAYDPSKPAPNTLGSSAEMRAQLTGLYDLISSASANASAALSGAIADTAQNPSSVGDLNISLSNPPQQGEVQLIIDKINELLAALRR
ncbi:MAG: hypothetical protein ABIP20_15400 [Chthoniobacteraceae bacterium]